MQNLQKKHAMIEADVIARAVSTIKYKVAGLVI